MQKFCTMNQEARQCVAIIFSVQISLFNISKVFFMYTVLTRFRILHLQLESAIKFCVGHHQERILGVQI